MAACLTLDIFPKMMEHLPASDDDAISESMALVDEAQIYLGIFARRYGYVPEGHEISITEMEYRRAVDRGIPRLIFLSDKQHQYTEDDFDTGPLAEQLQRLRSELEQEKVVAYFHNADSLRAKVSEALALQVAKSRNGSKLDSGNDAPDRPRAPPRLEDNPYRSLAAFQQEDASWYFGREDLTRGTVARFLSLLDGCSPSPRFLAILGPSGSGKSSFARAGLMARIAALGGGGQKLATIVPGDHPMASLAVAVASACSVDVKPFPANETEGGKEWPSPLEALPVGCCNSLILLVDQFEEVWSQCDDPAECIAFINSLLTAASAESGLVAVIITLRSDFLGQSQRHPELNTLLTQQSVLVPALTAEGLRAAIIEPALRAGHPLDESVIGALLDEALGREAVLPLLQFALSRIWQGMAAGVAPEETLLSLGGVGGALASEAESVYQQLNPEEQAIARRAFTAMVHLGEGSEDTRRRVSLEQMTGTDTAERVSSVLERFADKERRLITLKGQNPLETVDGSKNITVVEVTHEALFSHWKTLRQWLDQGRENIRLQRRLEAQVDAWRKGGRPPGSLWRHPDLSLLQAYHREHAADMSPDQIRFMNESEQVIEREERAKRDAENRRLEEARDRQRIAEQLQAQERRNKRNSLVFAGIMFVVAVASTGAAGFFAFATRYGLDVSQATHALKIRYGLRPSASSCAGDPVPPDHVALPCMLPIPSGDFLMGREGVNSSEKPLHKVTFGEPFTMSETEVTFDEYDAFATTLTQTPPGDSGWGRGDLPVIYVSWREAEEYAGWLGAVSGEKCELPTESEWEYTARAGTTTDYAVPAPAGTDNLEGQNLASCDGCGSEWDGTSTAPVGSFPPNAWGLYDMHGNVWEWVKDCWHDNYENAPVDGSAWLEANGGDCSRRVLRGGSWFNDPDALRSAFRGGSNPDLRFNDVGFRVVCRPH